MASEEKKSFSPFNSVETLIQVVHMMKPSPQGLCLRCLYFLSQLIVNIYLRFPPPPPKNRIVNRMVFIDPESQTTHNIKKLCRRSLKSALRVSYSVFFFWADIIALFPYFVVIFVILKIKYSHLEKIRILQWIGKSFPDGEKVIS